MGEFFYLSESFEPIKLEVYEKLLLSVVAAFCITASPAQSFEELLAPVHFLLRAWESGDGSEEVCGSGA